MSVLIGTEEAVQEIKKGRIIILVDDQNQQIVGNLTAAAEKATADTLNFMSKYGKGLPCLAMTAEKNQLFEMTMTVSGNGSRNGTPVAPSGDAVGGFTVLERTESLLTVIGKDVTFPDLLSSGHARAVRAQTGGVLARAGQAEGSVDLARLAGLSSAAIICEVTSHNGTKSRLSELVAIAEKHGLKICTIRDLIKYRMRTERLVRRTAQTMLPTEFGAEFKLIVYENDVDDHNHVALVMGEISSDEAVLIRVHSECLTGDVFGSRRCDCGPQLDEAMRMVAMAGKGVILYMQQEGRGIGLLNKIKAYALQDQGFDTVEANIRLGFKADLRDYSIAAQMLADLGIRQMRLMTNNPDKIAGLQRYGLELVEQVPIVIEPCATNVRYLRTKRDKMGHLFEHARH